MYPHFLTKISNDKTIGSVFVAPLFCIAALVRMIPRMQTCLWTGRSIWENEAWPKYGLYFDEYSSTNNSVLLELPRLAAAVAPNARHSASPITHHYDQYTRTCKQVLITNITPVLQMARTSKSIAEATPRLLQAGLMPPRKKKTCRQISFKNRGIVLLILHQARVGGIL